MFNSVVYIAIVQLVVNIIKNIVYRVMDYLFPRHDKKYQHLYVNN